MSAVTNGMAVWLSILQDRYAGPKPRIIITHKIITPLDDLRDVGRLGEQNEAKRQRGLAWSLSALGAVR